MRAKNGFRNSHPKKLPFFLTPPRVWLVGFLIWGGLLSGFLSQWLGTPGAIQAYRLNSLLQQKENTLISLQDDINQLKRDSDLLEKNRGAQLREIRKTLGYAASDELIFDFGNAGEI